jgi:hypothetical protein
MVLKLGAAVFRPQGDLSAFSRIAWQFEQSIVKPLSRTAQKSEQSIVSHSAMAVRTRQGLHANLNNRLFEIQGRAKRPWPDFLARR